jgi:hypothetical protein
METQFIILGDVHFCVVFELVDNEPQIIDKYSAEVVGDLREWLAQNGYPTPSELLQQRADANLAHGFYIRPHIVDRYFRVHEDDQIEEVNAGQFDDPILNPEGF